CTRRELTPRERQQDVSEILAHADAGKPRRGAMKEVGLLLRVPKNTASRLWKRAKNNAALYGVYEAPFMKRKCGRIPLDLSSALEQPPRRRVAALCIREGGQNTYNFAHMSEAKLRR
ncbi:hypothetical protein L916_19253, partial [Phytophthora nicotianae]